MFDWLCGDSSWSFVAHVEVSAGVGFFFLFCSAVCALLSCSRHYLVFPVIQSWRLSSPSTLIRQTASASNLTPRGSTSPQAAPTPWSACGTWRNWCAFAASPGQSVESLIESRDCVTVSVLNRQFSCRLDWPARTLSFSHDGKMLASASEDHFIDIAEVETGQYWRSISF